MKLGDIELISLSDGFFRLDGGAMFGVVPKPLWEKRTAPDDRNRITLGMRPLLVKTGTQIVLIDAGCGDKMSQKEHEIYALDRARNLDTSLADAGVAAADITTVIASHLHFDHAGGFTTRVDGRVRPRFPNARYIIRQGESDDATHPHERNRASYFAENFVPLAEAGVVDFVEADGEVLPGISLWRTGGHTMHHQLIKISGGGRTAVFAADLMPTSAHVDLAWIMGYDLYPVDTLFYKKAFLREAIDREYVIFFEHDPKMVAGIIGEKDGKRVVTSVI